MEKAGAAMLMVHGRGATAGSILSLAAEFDQSAFTFLAPQASGSTWYPNTFLAPLEQNEPWLSSALAVVSSGFERLSAAGIPASQTVLLGFSQGACLALEYAARNPARYGGVVGLSGGLIGPPGTPHDYHGSLNGTPVFLGCSDSDPHIPAWRVQESESVLRRMGAEVTARLYPDMGHTVNLDEIDFVRSMMSKLVQEKDPHQE